ncbi:PhaM family polyhydroxyalkanoate granule multifunctional regulatory protein [Xylophilus sp.]|uniref:PhaM family polyhydroxyalkanoate granule multifunctional regulatory protein n=1 Tax=Xylophilus sp. TaxID=2653893 RepID=UPI0013B6C0C2|nr:PhaM family polyhydroxyalkanoate granule multifunctional regulatory protein [Xylophilus sp.]KAF1044152.1 MAG: hypothetical protein GAK38_03678 [Xylophilus sp.]
MTTSSPHDAAGSSSAFDFSPFGPGLDFLQSLAKGAAQGLPQIPGLANWVTPTFDAEELDKRIQELKTVQFWLEQNARTLAATVQALEVQKLTLATLRGLNVNTADLAQAFTIKPPPAERPPEPKASSPAAPAPSAENKTPPQDEGAAAAAPPLIDPAQWWTQLIHQFQQIASTALQDAARAAVPGAAAAAPAPARANAPAPAAQKKAPAQKTAAPRRKAG